MTEFSDGPAGCAGGAGTDLFGNPFLPPRGPGRPPHVPTAETRAFVSMLFVCQHKPMAVASALGLKKSAFYEHYKPEIAERNAAALKYRGRQLIRLHVQAEAGNVAAEKALAGMIQAEQLKTASDMFGSKAKASPRKGIKQLRDEAAWDAGRENATWSDLLGDEERSPLPN